MPHQPYRVTPALEPSPDVTQSILSGCLDTLIRGPPKRSWALQGSLLTQVKRGDQDDYSAHRLSGFASDPHGDQKQNNLNPTTFLSSKENRKCEEFWTLLLQFHFTSKGDCRKCLQRRAPKSPQIGPEREGSPLRLGSGILQNCGVIRQNLLVLVA